uniref:Uncharacterized protein n=1 Tax=Candidatus Kentrum sp. MB TaxID=2138164 RepID=A0A451BD70_9GAMM|nr:MAG: hypothetical protein BECKMB1821I_GA0114274_102825 [Candidatus Kentron sp. MB]VFK76185.1 MAG: hypothetical protein BECKMB1821H_GA0114242_104517 [Candidatus Kentron sp. MB]
MKHLAKLLTVTLCYVLFCYVPASLAGSTPVYSEYSDAMVKTLTVPDEKAFVEKVLRGAGSIHLHAGVTNGKETKALSKPFSAGNIEVLLRCYGQDESRDQCAANDKLERSAHLGPSVKDAPSRMARGTRIIVAADSNTSAEQWRKRLAPLPRIRDGFRVSLSPKSGLAFITMGATPGPREKSAFTYRPATRKLSRSCALRCEKDRKAALVSNPCWRGRGGYIEKMEFLVPPPPGAKEKKAKPCSGLRPVIPGRNVNLGIRFPFSNKAYAQGSRRCFGIKSSPSIVSSHLRFELDLTWRPAHPGEYRRMPASLRRALAELAGTTGEDYNRPVQEKLNIMVSCR